MVSTHASGATVRLENLTKVYGGLVALDRLDLTIGAGEFFTLLGPSGSGKTTTLMLIAGFSAPTSGEIHLADLPLSRLPPHRRNIGVVFQNYNLFPHLSVADNIAFPLQLRGLDSPTIKHRVETMLQLVQLPELVDRMPHQLSGGQQQRVALARALVYQPPLLLLDEPLSALDKSLRASMQIELKELHRQLGMTIICVTHDQSEALAMSNRIAILNHGKLEQIGTPETLYEQPASRFVATFIGESNVIRGKFIDLVGEHASVSIGGDRIAYAQPMSSVGKGAACEILVRPHHIRIGEPATRERNSYSGVIRSKIYGGDSIKLEIGLGDQFVLAQVSNDADAKAAVATDSSVAWGFAPEHAMIYPIIERGLDD